MHYAEFDPDPNHRPPRRHVALREATTEADYFACAKLISGHEDGDVRQWLDRTRRHAHGPRNALLVAESATDGIVAYGRVTWFPQPRYPGLDAAPEGYYLGGLIVADDHRRMGIGQRLTLARMRFIQRRSGDAWYLVNQTNAASILLHERLGFHEATRKFTFPGVSFEAPGGLVGHRRFDNRGVICPGCAEA
ncbi:hypothetical protein Afil01_64970 [Actinorhabdospora filicis]|uniref:N-acetyltransferase domain-containing protein n=1 Tax=Actinorhabdospora filicis TaxID=1785913 RepID=A0A9W6STJ7_9ACTN|nr:GNAT family N-acetyltransferase [Actinorhabdospora filicis]GLZ81690.1 hypothetical protein Afil01_64970 [Actinorhabdospora filicis]